MYRYVGAVLVVVITAACGAPQKPIHSNPDPLAEASGRELFALGQRFASAGDLVRAEQYFAAAMQRGAAPQHVLPRLLEVCIQADRYRAAINYARRHLRRYPRDWPVRYLLAVVYAGQHQRDRALLEIEQILAVEPTQPEVYFLLGRLASDAIDERGLAIECFERYLALAPTGARATEIALWMKRHRRGRK
jgi:tetratricopeptide (TPR) repeat protein